MAKIFWAQPNALERLDWGIHSWDYSPVYGFPTVMDESAHPEREDRYKNFSKGDAQALRDLLNEHMPYVERFIKDAVSSFSEKFDNGDDFWLGISPDLDLNIHKENGIIKAILYPVDDAGNTKTNDWSLDVTYAVEE
jgi:hypothetical protein